MIQINRTCRPTVVIINAFHRDCLVSVSTVNEGDVLQNTILCVNSVMNLMILILLLMGPLSDSIDLMVEGSRICNFVEKMSQDPARLPKRVQQAPPPPPTSSPF